MKRFFLALFAILLIVLSALFYDVSSVKALSPYDGAVQVYNPMILERIGTGDEDYRDYSIDWYNEAVLATEIRCNQLGGQYCTIEADLRFLLDSVTSNWAVVPLFGSGSDQTAYGFKIVYSFSLDAEVELLLQPPDFSYATVTGGTFYATAEYIYQPSSPNSTENGTVLNGVGDSYDGGISYSTGTRKIFLSTYPVTYPPDYEGLPIPDTGNLPDSQEIRPEYSWKISPSGDLTVQYLKNITPFLTGSNFWVINETTEDWGATGAEVHNVTVQPAGWFNETFTLPGEGYYVFRIDHNQQLDSPPWPSVPFGSRHVKQVWVEFYWDGESLVTGTTEGCTADVCNDLKDENKGSYFFGADLDDHGLSAFVTAPLSFIQGLSSAECEPLTLPPIAGESIVLPCLKPYYQEHANALYLIWQTVISGVVAYLVAINSFARIKAISSPKDDSIEVYKL